jgi:leucyl aminopeptidase
METFGEGANDIDSMEGEGEGADENAEEQHDEKEHSQAIVVDDNRAHNQKWEKFTVKMEVSAATPPNLAVYLKTKQIRCDTIENLLLALETAVNEMKAVTTELTDETLVSTHERQQAEIVSMENNVTMSFYNNDKRRKDLLKKMNVANKKWEKLYTDTARRILNAVRLVESVRVCACVFVGSSIFRCCLIKGFLPCFADD